MLPIRVDEFAKRCGGTAHGFANDAEMTSFALDSREAGPGSLFVAIKGARVDGHAYVSETLKSGAIGSLVERPVEGPHVLVGSVVEALARFAASARAEFTGPVIGITGSAGKTSTKEFVAAAVSPLGPVLKTHGNRNTEYTVPLLWAELEPKHQVAVVEMSMRGFGQIRHLASFSKPTIGLVTNVGFAHIEMVGSREGIAEAKAELLEALPEDGFALLWAADAFLKLLKSKTRAQVRTFGYTGAADCQITSYKPLNWTSSEVQGTLDGRTWKARLPAVGHHMAVNASAAVLAASCAGVDPREAAARLESAELPPMRMEVRELNGTTLVLDTYNASPPSFVAAVETLAELPAAGRRMAVVGEMKELGEHSREAHREVGAAIATHHLDEVLFMGEATEAALAECRAMGMEHVRMGGSHEDVREFIRQARPGDVVLIKGSRALELELALEPATEATR